MTVKVNTGYRKREHKQHNIVLMSYRLDHALEVSLSRISIA